MDRFSEKSIAKNVGDKCRVAAGSEDDVNVSIIQTSKSWDGKAVQVTQNQKSISFSIVDLMFIGGWACYDTNHTKVSNGREILRQVGDTLHMGEDRVIVTYTRSVTDKVLGLSFQGRFIYLPLDALLTIIVWARTSWLSD